MESGYAFLHPKNALILADKGFKRDYAPIPFSPWRPCIPPLERLIPPTGLAPLLYRYVRVTWILVALPVWIGLVLLFEVLPERWGDALGPAILPRRSSWTLWQRITYPLLARSVWSVTFGLPPPSSPQDDRNIPVPAKLWYGRGTEMQPVNAAFSSKDEEDKWMQDEAVDPAGIIKPQGYLAAFWIRSKNIKNVPKKTGIEVVLYLVGGGYITGHPLEASRVFDIARQTSLPVLGVNYRKSVSANRAFPAALQDTLSGYAFLIRQGYKRIAVAGDSAGAGLALALMQFLAKMAGRDEKPDDIVMPYAACFYSPWADLTFSHDYRETVHFDIIHPTMLRAAASAYTSTIERYSNAQDATVDGSIAQLGVRHPYFSPALGEMMRFIAGCYKKNPFDMAMTDSSVESLRKIKTTAEKLGQKPPNFLIFVGGAELFSAEVASLCRNLREAGLQVEEYREDDEVQYVQDSFHVPGLLLM